MRITAASIQPLTITRTPRASRITLHSCFASDAPAATPSATCTGTKAERLPFCTLWRCCFATCGSDLRSHHTHAPQYRLSCPLSTKPAQSSAVPPSSTCGAAPLLLPACCSELIRPFPKHPPTPLCFARRCSPSLAVRLRYVLETALHDRAYVVEFRLVGRERRDAVFTQQLRPVHCCCPVQRVSGFPTPE